MKYPNVVGILGLNTKETQKQNNDILVNCIKNNNLLDKKIYQYNDTINCCNWFVFYTDVLTDSVENIVYYILNNDSDKKRILN